MKVIRFEISVNDEVGTITFNPEEISPRAGFEALQGIQSSCDYKDGLDPAINMFLMGANMACTSILEALTEGTQFKKQEVWNEVMTACAKRALREVKSRESNK